MKEAINTNTNTNGASVPAAGELAQPLRPLPAAARSGRAEAEA